VIIYAILKKEEVFSMALVKEKKTKIIEDFKHHSKDTGSPSIQIALLTERINALTDHFKAHKKDHASRRGLLKLVSRRRGLLDYLKGENPKQYEELIEKLNLRK
jgi:small subunit ribosomal protein S15